MLDASGRPIGLAGLACHTPEIFPANLLLCYLIMKGHLDNILSPYKMKDYKVDAANERSNAKKKLVLVLAHLMFRLHPKDSEPLQALPDEILHSWKGYNQFVMKIQKNFESLLGKLNYPAKNSPHLSTKPPNRYLYDLYTTKQWGVTLRNSKLGDSLMYSKVDNFIAVLRKIHTALAQLSMEPELDPFVLVFQEIVNDFKEILEEAADYHK